jgi:hypothetical protein
MEPGPDSLVKMPGSVISLFRDTLAKEGINISLPTGN